jgi:peptidoglycan/LPS O-acetylase OafA/YrhL
MGIPMDLTNIFAIPTWGLIAFALALVGGLVAALVGVLRRRAPAWALGLVPLAGVAAFAAATAPENMMTLTVALASTGLALAMLLTGTFALTPAGTGDEEASSD